MILDSIDKPSCPVAAALEKALGFIRGMSDDTPEGEYEIDGKRMFARVSRYETVSTDRGRFEAHRKYADVQALLEGEEDIGWAPLGSMPESDYDSESDVSFYPAQKKTGCIMRLVPGLFAFFMPSDAHMPMLSPEGKTSSVTKVVVKIDISLLDWQAPQDV